MGFETQPPPHEVDLLAIADQVLDWATGDEAVEVVISHDRSTEVRSFNGDVESFVSSETQGAGIRVVRGTRQGFAWAGSLDTAVLSETLAEARDNVAFATEDPAVGLAVPDGVVPPALRLVDEALAGVDPETKIALAIELERLALSGDSRIVGIESAEYADSISSIAVASTTGIRCSDAETSCSLVVYTLAGHDDETTTGFGFSVGRGLDELDLEATATVAVERAVAMLGARRTPSRRLRVVFDPWVTAQFLSVICEGFSGTEVVRGRSWLAERVGEQIAPSFVTLGDRPTDARWLGASAFDAEGLASRDTPLVVNGVVQGFVHDTYSARVLGTASTAAAVRAGYKSTPTAGVRAGVLDPGTASPTSLIADVADGLYVSEVQGMHSGVNPVSGDFSTGVEGRVIRGGELAEPVREVTIASTLPRMLSEIIAVGDDLTAMPMDTAGVTLVIDDVTVSGG